MITRIITGVILVVFILIPGILLSGTFVLPVLCALLSGIAVYEIVKCFGQRNNCFGALHMCDETMWIDPSAWRTEGSKWTYEYCLKDIGVLSSPIIEILK